MAGDGRIGVVATGGGARGAYEAGALSVLVPELERRGERPSVFVGVSVGAINAIGLAGGSDLPGGEVAARLVQRWRTVTQERVFGSVLFRQIPVLALRYLATFAGLPGGRLPAVLDPRALEASLEDWIDWDQLHRSTESGAAHAAACVTTHVVSGRTVVFGEGAVPAGVTEAGRLRYVRARLGIPHVRASSSIPVLFPPARIEEPREARGWYMDGSTRLRRPLVPALELGAERLVVLAPASAGAPGQPRREDLGERVGLGDAAANLLEGILVDPLIDDVRRLGKRNVQFAEDRGRLDAETLRRRHPHGEVPYLLVHPPGPGDIADLATEVLDRRYRGAGALRSPNTWFLDRVFGGRSPLQGELLSYLLFDEEFIEELMALGRRDARRALAADGGEPWRTAPPEEEEAAEPAEAAAG